MAKPAQTPAPVDRPLSKAYLRGFGGWAPEFPPGSSDPNTLRSMTNMIVNRNGSLETRPGMYPVFATAALPGMLLTPFTSIVGDIEPFVTYTGRNGFLFAARQADNKVALYVAIQNTAKTGYDLLNANYNDGTLGNATVYFGQGSGADRRFATTCTWVSYAQIDNKIFVFPNSGESPLRLDLDTRWLWLADPQPPPTGGPLGAYTTDAPVLLVPDSTWVSGAQTAAPGASVTPTTSTLVSSDSTKNIYSFGFFYTFTNALGETQPSQMAILRTQRPLSQWLVNGSDYRKSADQIIPVVNPAEYSNAGAAPGGAGGWRMYMVYWAQGEPVPVEGVLVGEGVGWGAGIDPYEYGWARATGYPLPLDTPTHSLPYLSTDDNYTDIGFPEEALVAGDRLITVRNKKWPGRIFWSSNLLGKYGTFSPSLGGGFKTLSSGNLYVPSCAVLWQNPQSVDTITILCDGINGKSTSFYMSPSSVSGLNGATQIMSFEETTATPGTVSPRGVEVMNNALYHPLDHELMKSTAANYNINHKSMTDDVSQKWKRLRNKNKIVSTQFDGRLYYLVDNPDGVAVPTGCNGNEIWVCDSREEAIWSRWTIPAVSVTTLSLNNQTYVAAVLPTGIYIFDPTKTVDLIRATYNVSGTSTVIPWSFETNTQGMNRAHDMLARVKQLSVQFGGWTGRCEYGIKTKDRHGRELTLKKTFVTPTTAGNSDGPSDYVDNFELSTDMMTWSFFANNVSGQTGAGAFDYIQYMAMPLTKNYGAELGSVETFEYKRSIPVAINGVPKPMADTRVP